MALDQNTKRGLVASPPDARERPSFALAQLFGVQNLPQDRGNFPGPGIPRDDVSKNPQGFFELSLPTEVARFLAPFLDPLFALGDVLLDDLDEI